MRRGVHRAALRHTLRETPAKGAHQWPEESWSSSGLEQGGITEFYDMAGSTGFPLPGTQPSRGGRLLLPSAKYPVSVGLAREGQLRGTRPTGRRRVTRQIFGGTSCGNPAGAPCHRLAADSYA